METATRARMDGRAVASAVIALVAAVTSQSWIIGTLAATLSITLALAARRALRKDDELRGTVLSLAGFLVSLGVLVFVTVGPTVLFLLLYVIAPI